MHVCRLALVLPVRWPQPQLCATPSGGGPRRRAAVLGWVQCAVQGVGCPRPGDGAHQRERKDSGLALFAGKDFQQRRFFQAGCIRNVASPNFKRLTTGDLFSPPAVIMTVLRVFLSV